jgi:hypothetical protein
MADMSKYSGAAYLKVGDVRAYGGSIRGLIVDVGESVYGRPLLVFDDGTRLSLNTTNNKRMCRAYGNDSDDWIEKEIELTLGEIEYEGSPKEAILVQPISPTIEKKPQPKEVEARPPSNSRSSDIDDEIPFALAFLIVGAAAWLVAGGSTLIA